MYMKCHDKLMDLTINIVCGSCGCTGHDSGCFESISVENVSLRQLYVDPALVCFDFSSGVRDIDDLDIMIDPLSVVSSSTDGPSSISICSSCQKYLKKGIRPPESLANLRWIGPVPPDLQDLTWIEELLIARAHLTGWIVRLQNRNAVAHFGLKGHIILLPQDTTKLLDLLPLPPSALLDIVRVVWVSKPVRSVDTLREHFSVRTQRVYDALLWLTQNNEDYRDVIVDYSLFQRWPPVWVAEDLLNGAGDLEDGSDEDNARIGAATEGTSDSDLEGGLLLMASAVVDIDSTTQLGPLNALQHVSLWKNDQTINVVTGNTILNDDTLPSYFTSAFPTIFPWGTGKHLDSQRNKGDLPLKKWVQLLLRNSSRCVLTHIGLANPSFKMFSKPSGICGFMLGYHSASP